MKFVDDGRRRAGWRQHTEPGRYLEVRKARFDHGRKLRHVRRALERSHRKRTQLALACGWEYRPGILERHGDAPGHHVSEVRAAIGNMNNVDSRCPLQDFASDMLRRA